MVSRKERRRWAERLEQPFHSRVHVELLLDVRLEKCSRCGTEGAVVVNPRGRKQCGHCLNAKESK